MYGCSVGYNEGDELAQYMECKIGTLVNVPIEKYAPYKKLLICCLNRYDSMDSESSQQQFVNIIDEIL